MSEFVRADFSFYPFNTNQYNLFDVLGVMEKNKINILACFRPSSQKEDSLHVIRNINTKTKQNYLIGFNFYKDEENILSFKNRAMEDFYLVLGEEIFSADKKYRFLSVGAVNIKKSNHPEEIIEQILEKDGLPLLSSYFNKFERLSREDFKEKERKIISLYQKYPGKLVLEQSVNSFNLLKKSTSFLEFAHKRIKKISIEHEVPVIPTAKIFAFNKKSLKSIGSSFIEIESSFNYPDFIKTLKENIFSLNYSTHSLD